MINARAETLAERPAFRDALKRRRSGAATRRTRPRRSGSAGAKQPWWITRPDGAPFAFAGLWATWRPRPDVEPLRTCTIVTTAAAPDLRDVHARMPVMLEPGGERAWLDPATAGDALRDLLMPFAGTTRVPVGRGVGDAGHDAPDCIAPVPFAPDEPAAPTLF
jgi:putative SOS response-associated peptidase YedK